MWKESHGSTEDVGFDSSARGAALDEREGWTSYKQGEREIIVIVEHDAGRSLRENMDADQQPKESRCAQSQRTRGE